ncbi:MAG: hypothetical protein WCL16_11415 [bacterium]
MKRKRIALAVLLVGVAACAWAGDLYFGGHGDTNSHWTGYSVALASDGLTNWVAYTLDRPGKTTKAPATFHRTDTNEWSAIFDEHVFTTNGGLIGLAGHKLVVLGVDPGGSLTIQDGTEKVTLQKITADELKRIEKGRPNKPSEGTR